METIISTTPTISLKAEEASILRELASTSLPKLTELLGHQAPLAYEFLKTRPATMEELAALPTAGVLVEYAWDVVYAKQEQKLNAQLETYTKRGENRSMYLPEPRFIWRDIKSEGGEVVKSAWRFETTLISAGLIKALSATLYPKYEEPVVLSMINTSQEEEVPSAAMDLFMGQGIYMSGHRLGWNITAPTWKLLLSAFPDAIDFRAYNHSLNSPLAPQGLFANQKVIMRVIKDLNGKPMGADGSGRIHPDHPVYKALRRPYATPCMQFRAINEKGTFCKGILVPDERCVSETGEPEIWFDWLQIKGRNKKAAKQFAKEDRVTETVVHLGILQNIWDRPREISSGFEVLENIGKTGNLVKVKDKRRQDDLVEDILNTLDNQEIEVDEAEALVYELVDGAMEELADGGVNKLVKKACKDDERLQLMKILCEEMGISPTEVPVIREAMNVQLQKELYRIATGAGFYGKQMVTVIDNSLQPGTCVCAHYKPGTEVAVWRFPNVLAQGMNTLTSVAPKSYHQVKGETIRYCVFMNAQDLVWRHQGDDDGDIVGITSDKRVVRLFRNRSDNEIFHIEPEGTPLTLADGITPIPTMSPEGYKYIQGNPMGEVGIYTNYRSDLLAAGDQMGALAMSLLIQEAIDTAKKNVRWSDFPAAAHLSNWEKHEDGWHFNMKLEVSDTFFTDGELDAKKVGQWVSARLAALGIIQYIFEPETSSWVRYQRPCAWRQDQKDRGEKKRRLNPEHYAYTAERGNWEGGNLVHAAYDRSFDCWREIESLFTVSTGDINLQKLLVIWLKMKGITVPEITGTYEHYLRGLKHKSGLKKLNNVLEKLSTWGEEESMKRREEAYMEFEDTIKQLSLMELITVWHWETSINGNINNAFRAVCWSGSPIMALAGETPVKKCDWLTDKKMELTLGLILQSTNPHIALAERIRVNTTHGQSVKDKNGEAIPFWACPDCVEKAQTALVQHFRQAREPSTIEWCKNIQKKLKS